MSENEEKYADYACGDYFESTWSEVGFFDELSQTLVIVPAADTYELREMGFFAIGRSGMGGIDFGYRKKYIGLWAFYPIEQEFKFMAESIRALVDAWCSGHLSV